MAVSEDNSKKESIVNRIISILSVDALKAWFDCGLADEYTKRFNERLPSDWIDFVKESPLIEVEVFKLSNVTKTLIALKNPKKTAKKSESMPESKPESLRASPSTPNADDSISALIESLRPVSPEPQTIPKPISLPETETWDVIVTKVVNTGHIFVRLTLYSEEYVKLMNEMNDFYSKISKPLNEVIVDKIYALTIEDLTYRVRARSVNNRIVNCICVDEGEEFRVDLSINKLHEIDNRFLELSFQAIACSLSGLELYNGNAVASNKLKDLIQSLEGNALVAVPISRDDPISIKLFDTSIEDSDRNINSEVLQYLYKHCYDDIMTTPDSQCSVCITNCTALGDIYVQIEGQFYATYDKLKDQTNALCSGLNALIPSMDALQEELNKCDKNYYYILFENDWCRALIMNIESSESIKVFYVDFGNDQIVSQSQIRYLESPYDPLVTIPYLAVRCRLEANVQWNDLTADLFYEQFTLNDIMKMKVISPQTSANCASVEIFDKMVSLNQKLIAAHNKATTDSTVINGNNGVNHIVINGISNDKLNYTDDKNVNNSCDVGGDDVIFGGNPIPSPALPAVKPNPINADDFFDLIVLLAANPFNFIVIPFKNINTDSEFNRLKQIMHDFYEKEENHIELPHTVIKKNLYVAGKYRNNWYRIQVKEIYCENPFEVICYLVDYGEHQNFTLKDIQPLFNEFRALPMQAMRAALATVEPKGDDWDGLTCFEFRKIVENKPFVATVLDIKQVEGQPVLKLALCDTSGADDVYVGKLLVEKGLAKQRISI